MKDVTISSYFNLIDRILKSKGYFFCANSAEKVMDGKALRFLEYPWRANHQTIIFEKDPLLRLVNLSPAYIRLEQIP